MEPIYKEIPGYPGYRVGNDGSLWTCRRKGGSDRGANRLTNTWRRLKATSNNGYLRVALVQDGKSRSRSVHCLVLEAFVGPCPAGMEACHYPDANRANNQLSNLRWATRSENAKDKYRDKPPTTEKKCRRCGVIKPLAGFYRDSRAVDRRKTECKQCHVGTAITSRDATKKQITNRDYMRRWRAKKRASSEVAIRISGG